MDPSSVNDQPNSAEQQQYAVGADALRLQRELGAVCPSLVQHHGEVKLSSWYYCCLISGLVIDWKLKTILETTSVLFKSTNEIKIHDDQTNQIRRTILPRTKLHGNAFSNRIKMDLSQNGYGRLHVCTYIQSPIHFRMFYGRANECRDMWGLPMSMCVYMFWFDAAFVFF